MHVVLYVNQMISGALGVHGHHAHPHVVVVFVIDLVDVKTSLPTMERIVKENP